MEKYGLIGAKLSHSFSPQIHSKLGDYPYELYELEESQLEDFLDKTSCQGFNVTIPYKKKIMEFCTEISDEARKIGAVNTLVRNEKGGFTGYNTDYFGMKKALEKAEISLCERKCIILGSGGASETAKAVAADCGASEIVVISRGGRDNYENINRHFDAEIIINTTPVGMYPDNLVSPVNLDDFYQCKGVFDLIYNPNRTKLILDGMRKSIPCGGGLFMLVAQAAKARELFGNVKISESEIERVFNEIQDECLNLIYIGMPGSGKTTLAREKAKELNRPFIDIDELIVERCGMSIPEIFKEQGEPIFRKVESQVLRQVCKESGQVIATGGGVVTKWLNYNILKQNGTIVWVQRDIANLATCGRPLSESMDINTLYEERKAAYSIWSDYSIFNEER